MWVTQISWAKQRRDVLFVRKIKSTRRKTSCPMTTGMRNKKGREGSLSPTLGSESRGGGTVVAVGGLRVQKLGFCCSRHNVEARAYGGGWDGVGICW